MDMKSISEASHQATRPYCSLFSELVEQELPCLANAVRCGTGKAQGAYQNPLLSFPSDKMGIGYSREGGIEIYVGVDLQRCPVFVDGGLDVEYVQNRRDHEESRLQRVVSSWAYSEPSHIR